jgi:hypothetical protein
MVRRDSFHSKERKGATEIEIAEGPFLFKGQTLSQEKLLIHPVETRTKRLAKEKDKKKKTKAKLSKAEVIEVTPLPA